MPSSETLSSWAGRKMLTWWCIYQDQEGCGPWFVLCVFIWGWMWSWSHAVPLVFSMLQIWAALSENGDRLTDVRLRSWMLYGADLCQQSQLCRQLPAPYSWRCQIWAGIRLRTREGFLAQAACSYLNCFPWVWDSTAIPVHHPSLDACLLCGRGRQLEKAVGCPSRL